MSFSGKGTAGYVYTATASTGEGKFLPPAGGTIFSTISANQALASGHGYAVIAPGGVILLSLPATSSVGDTIEVVLDGATSWTITQGAAQQIRLGNAETTAGVGGSLTSTLPGDFIRIRCETANLRWVAMGFTGNITVV